MRHDVEFAPAAARLRPARPRDLPEDPEPVLADAAVAPNVVVAQLGSEVIRRVGALAGRRVPQQRTRRFERPAQVDRRRPGRRQERGRPVERSIGGVRPHRQRNPVRRGRADQRRTPHDHVADRPGRVRSRLKGDGLEPVRQERLVDDPDLAPVAAVSPVSPVAPVAPGEDGPVGDAADVHGAATPSTPQVTGLSLSARCTSSHAAQRAHRSRSVSRVAGPWSSNG